MENTQLTKMTQEQLKSNVFEKNRLEQNPFPVEGNADGSCILIMGINPAGNTSQPKDFVYCIPNSKSTMLKGKVNNTYCKATHEFCKRIMNEKRKSVKWDWCNNPTQEIKELMVKCADVENYYNDSKSATCTIVQGDMFYYHETSQKKFHKRIVNPDGAHMRKYCEDILKEHIKILLDKFNKIEFIYINNATVAHWLNYSNVPCKTMEYVDYNGTQIPVFYGGMLSGGRQMDTFAKERLIKEIQSHI